MTAGFDNTLYELFLDVNNDFPADDAEDPDYVYDDTEEDDVQDADETNITITRSMSERCIGKKGYVWNPEPVQRVGRAAPLTIKLVKPASRSSAVGLQNPFDIWKQFVDKYIIDRVVLHTNEEINRVLAKRAIDFKNKKIKRKKYSWHRITTSEEIYAIIGLLYLAGVQKAGKLNVAELWSKSFGLPIFRLVMTEKRFKFLMATMRFDSKETRTDRQYLDNFAPIRDIWDHLVENCIKLYTPSQNLTIDEQLLTYRGNCPFRVYIPSKPGKYGLKILSINDVSTSYMFNAIPYVGVSKSEKDKKEQSGSKSKTDTAEPPPKKKKDDDGHESKPEHRTVDYYVTQLTKPIHNTTRSITCDNWFSSVPLFQKMLVEYKLTMTGTLRKNKEEIPPAFIGQKNADESLFCFDATKVLTSYSPQKNKNVLLLSTHGVYYNNNVNPTSKKPYLIEFYNATKSGTDTFDQFVSIYTVARKTNRWPMRMFFGMLDQAGVNSMVLFTLNKRQKEKEKEREASTSSAEEVKEKKVIRRVFLRELAMDMVKPWLRIRRLVPTLPPNLRAAITEILEDREPDQDDDDEEEEPSAPAVADVPQTSGTLCRICYRDDGIKRKKIGDCDKCGQGFCKAHQLHRCTDCVNKK